MKKWLPLIIIIVFFILVIIGIIFFITGKSNLSIIFGGSAVTEILIFLQYLEIKKGRIKCLKK